MDLFQMVINTILIINLTLKLNNYLLYYVINLFLLPVIRALRSSLDLSLIMQYPN